MDPLIQDKMIGKKAALPTNMSRQRLFAVNSTRVESGESFKELIKEWDPYGFNVVFSLLSGDIGF